MTNHPMKYLFRFCLLVAIQVLVLNKINLRWWAVPGTFPLFVPYLYPILLLTLPFSTRVPALLAVGFLLGLSVDVFSNTAGMHASACVLVAYLRTNVLAALLPKHLSEYGRLEPTVKTMGWFPFFTYAAVLLFAHHLLYFILQFWSGVSIGMLALKILCSLLTSLVLVLAYVLLFTRQSPLLNTSGSS
ncbi:MAG: rod shape-determining protein MreD [Sphingobacteriales bacterium]|nr:MAG: rod shape-determining protein MreD [Sphingobacteriales bacterium]